MRSAFRVIRTVREKHACRRCDRIVQAPAPSRPIERGSPDRGCWPVLTSKYAEHIPLYRQSEIYARQGVVLSRSVLSGWVDACCRLLAPLDEALQHYVLTDGKLHADDMPVPVLLPGNKKTKTGRLWTYVRDDRNAGSALAPQCGSLTARTEKVSTLRPILQASVAYCRLMPTPGSTSSTATAI